LLFNGYTNPNNISDRLLPWLTRLGDWERRGLVLALIAAGFGVFASRFRPLRKLLIAWALFTVARTLFLSSVTALEIRYLLPNLVVAEFLIVLIAWALVSGVQKVPAEDRPERAPKGIDAALEPIHKDRKM
jgi:hypothetical protein